MEGRCSEIALSLESVAHSVSVLVSRSTVLTSLGFSNTSKYWLSTPVCMYVGREGGREGGRGVDREREGERQHIVRVCMTL